MEYLRKPAVAGSFYPSSPTELNTITSALLKKAEKVSTKSVKILIVPHAGITFSGQISAEGFKQVAGKNYTRIILLGASHRHFSIRASVFGKGVWETPLGKTEIDENLAKNLLKGLLDNDKIVADIAPHLDEHSLEIELIFLQKVLNNFKIVPILLSQASDDLINALAAKISQNLDDETLLVISTDLSHYPPYEVANKVDNETIKAIMTGKKEIFEKTITDLENQGYPGVETCACGAEAVKVALKVGEILNLEFKKIKYANSGDSGGDKSQVVGYAAIAGYEKTNSATEPLDDKAKKEALAIARRTLEEHLKSPLRLRRGFSRGEAGPKNQSLTQPLGAFITLRNKGQLRGCIGEFEPKEPLYKVIQDMVIEAATNDPRFSPVTKEELPEIKIEISVMTPKKKITDWQKIQLGKHGVVVQKGFRSGTFLPQVATETGWSLEEFLGHLCSDKAGLPSDCYKDSSINLYTFEAQIFEEE